jgi:osmotically-inducible protein OsmY
MKSTTRSFTGPLILALAAATVSLSACAPVVVGGAAAGTAVVVTDRRTSGVQLEDQNISFKVERAMSQKFGDTARISANAYNGQVLLTGDAPSEAVKDQATGLARGVESVKTVVNQITVTPLSPFSSRSNDTWITSKVRSELLNTKFVPSGSISITTDKGVVYLQGKVTQAEGEYAANATAGVGGVTKVVKLFDIISRDEAVRLSGSNASTPASSTSATPAQAPIETGGAATDGSSAGSSGVQAIPIK